MSSRGYDPLNSFDFGSGINDINPEDIESMEILKGAKASVLYGSKAANGVVLITTKRGETTRGLGVTVSYQHTIEQPHSYIDWQNEYGEGTSLNFPELAEGQTMLNTSKDRYSFGPKFDGREMMFVDGSPIRYQAYPNNFDDLFRQGSSDTFTAAISGGNERGAMRLSYTNYNYQGMMDNNYQKKNSISFSGSIKASDFATFDVTSNLHLIDSHNRMGNWQDLVAWGIHRSYDYNRLHDRFMTDDGFMDREFMQDGGWNSQDSSVYMMNMWWSQERNSNLDSKMHNISSARITLNFTPWLYFIGQAGIDFTDTDYTTKAPMTYKDPYTGGRYAFSRNNSFMKNYMGSINFEKRFVDDQLGVLVMMTGDYLSQAENNIGVATYGGFNYPDWYSLGNGVSFPSLSDAGLVRNHSRGSEVLYGLMGQATIDWKGTYYLEFQARNDWASTLPVGNNSYFYPGVSFTYNFSDNLKIPKLSYGKLFTSFADVGRPAPRYFALKSYNIGVIEQLPDVNTVTGPDDLFAGDIRPERKREFEIGLATRWFNNRVELNYSFYTNNVYDQIMPVPLSNTTSAANIRINAGNVRNWGHEVHIKGTPIETRDLRLDLNLTMANWGSKVIKLFPGITQMSLDPSMTGYSVIAKEGQKQGEILMFDYNKDEQGNRIVGSDGMYSLDRSEFKSIGKNINPDLLGGFIADLTYKGAFLHVGLDYKFGGSIFSYSNYYLTALGQTSNTLKYRDESHGGIAYYENEDGQKIRTEHSKTAGPNGEEIRHNGMILEGVKDNGDGTYSKNDIIANSTSFYQSFGSDMGDAYQPDMLYRNDYIKLREVAIGYTLPKRWSETLKLQRVTVQLNARNLFYLYKTLPNLDAESALGTSGKNVWEERSYLPTMRSYGFKVDISF
jgi:iron complex outermembrane receptor protein